MSDIESDNIPDISADDKGKMVKLLEPLLVSENLTNRAALTDLAVELAVKSAGFRRSLPGGIAIALADLVRVINCYYSNLIGGHDIHPVDIERALKNDFSDDETRRNFQLEAKAHITAQKWIDDGGLSGFATSVDSITEIHRLFCALLPEELLWTENPENGARIKLVPGVLRQRDVKVGRHIPVSPGALPRFLMRFESDYAKLGKTDTILAAASAHHRLLWLHPFLDGNGRVARLMSHAMLLETLDTGGVWSIARGLARNESTYKSQLMACDAERRNDLEGRGHLSEEALAQFTKFFLTTCIDQVEFMEELVQSDRLRNRILIWTEEEIRADALPPKSGNIIETILYRGELPRGEIAALLGTSDRHARRVTSALISREVLASESSRAPLRLAFPAKLASRWMPGLVPEIN